MGRRPELDTPREVTIVAQQAAARMRPTVSEALPAANGTTNVIGRVGQFWVGRVCAITDEDASAAIERHRLKKRSMLGSSWLAVWLLARSKARTVPGRQGDLPRYP